nr:reverse transcriptase domain-containing protein [Tanacetum cinerariifolium]
MCSDEHGMDVSNGNLNMDLNRENMDTVKAIAGGTEPFPSLSELFPVRIHHDIQVVGVLRLSVMATKLGNPIMLDSYTSSMCLQSWGHMDYARALIDIKAYRELKKDMVIAIPNVEDN